VPEIIRPHQKSSQNAQNFLSMRSLQECPNFLGRNLKFFNLHNLPKQTLNSKNAPIFSSILENIFSGILPECPNILGSIKKNSPKLPQVAQKFYVV